MIDTIHVRRTARWFASISTLALATTVHAQVTPPPADTTVAPGTAPAPSPSAAVTTAGGGLEDIVVTARKRSESLQNIPVAVTAYSPAQIQRYDISSIDKIAASTPNLTVGSATTGSGAQITLRGIGSPASALGIEQSVAVVVDGAYYGNGRILNEGFFDLGQIEVLKGPQALFFGKNATAGVISITTANPGSHFEGSTRVGYEFNAQRPYIEQVISTPITDTLGVRVALRASKMFQGYARNLAGPVTFSVSDIATGTSAMHTASAASRNSPKALELLGRLTLQWKPIEGLTNTFKLGGSYNHVNDPAWNNLIFACATGFSTLQPGVRCQRKWTYYHNNMPAEIAANFPNASKDGHLYNRYKSWEATNNLEYRMDDISLTSTTNYQFQRNQWLSDSDYQSRPTQIYVGSRERWRAFSEEARALTTYDSPLNAMVGVLYQNTHLFADQDVYSGNVMNSAAPPKYQYVAFAKLSTTSGETISPYAQVTWKVIPKVEIAGGVRYTHETKDSFFQHPYVRPGQNYFTTPITANQTFNNWTPEVTVSYKPTNHINLYAGYKTGYKSGGFSNESSYTTSSRPSDLAFGPEKARGFEGGIKTTLLDNQLRFDVALFRYKYSDLQVDFFEAQSFRYVTTNAGSARTSGVELTSEFAPRSMPGLSIHGTLNYVKAKYIRFLAPCYTGQTPAMGCNTASPFGGLFGQDLSGSATANAPKWTASFGGNYETEVRDGIKLGVAGDGRYSSSYIGSPFGNPLTRQPKYINVDASIYLRSERGWELSVIGKNLSNQFVISGALDSPSTGSGTGTAAGILADQRGYTNTPRTVQLQLTVRY